MTVIHLNQSEKGISKSATDKRKDSLLQAVAVLGFASIIFAAVPEVDLVVSRLFWNPISGFELNKNSALIVFRDINRFLPWIVIAVAAGLLIPNPVFRRVGRPPAPHKVVFVITFYAVGPGLFVHLIKMLVGRARPRFIQEFGGNAVFTPPWEIADQCARSCSFISGESASAFALLTLVVCVNEKYSTVYVITTIILAAGFSFNRVLHGAHFLSDVVISWSVMLVLAVLLWGIFSRNAPKIDAVFGGR